MKVTVIPHLFEIGQRVTRNYDGAIGTVEQYSMYDGEALYGVRLDKNGEIWSAGEQRWIAVETEEHTCHGAIFCGQDRETAKAECLACQPTFIPVCDSCLSRPAGHGHFALYCEPCSELPYGVSAPVETCA